MNRSESLQKMRSVLLSRRSALLAALAGDLKTLTELSQAGGDLADVALDTAQEDITSQMAEVESRELTRVDEALGRIHEGKYGVCEECDKPIPLARLKALPYATLCIQCQTKLEKTGRRGWSDLGGDVYDSTRL